MIVFAAATALAVAGASANAADCPWAPTGDETKDEKIDYGAPFFSKKTPVVWGRAVLEPDGAGLAFGGQDTRAADGTGHTCLREDGRWISIVEELRAANPLQKIHERIRAASKLQQDVAARLRYLYFHGAPAPEQAAAIAKDVAPAQDAVARELAGIEAELGRAPSGASPYHTAQARIARERIAGALGDARAVRFPAGQPASAEAIRALHKLIIDIDQAADPIGAEPPARAASPLAYDGKTGLYVVFGGDHFDYLMNDTWVFDPRRRAWQERHPSAAPSPRVNHTLVSLGDGTVAVTGGLTYTSATEYLARQYAPLKDGTWTYDIAANSWRGTAAGGEPGRREYRKGLHQPDAFLEGPRPDAAAGEARLAELPANSWVALNPKPLPVLHRTWGTTVLDADLDLLLRWSGGHKAHSGTDVLHYHPATNRWELPIPIEFPLGAIHSWEVPFGVNFNRRPWMTFHTYRTYAYDRAARALIWMGRGPEYFLYDPVRAEWGPKLDAPRGMAGHWMRTVEATSEGTFLLDTEGRLWRYQADERGWTPIRLTGVALPGAAGDASAMTYDPLRRRLLVARGDKDSHRYDGQLYAVDLATKNVTRLNPQFRDGARSFSFMALMTHDPRRDLMVVGAVTNLGGPQRTPAYDPVGNRWVSLRIGGANPYAIRDNIWSLEPVYDAKRDLFWSVDPLSRVFALRLDLSTADVRPLTAP